MGFGCAYWLFDGSAIYKVWAADDLECGVFLDGRVEWRSGEPILVEKRVMIGPESVGFQGQPVSQKGGSGVVPHEWLWGLQIDAYAMEASNPSGAQFLAAALDAVMSGHLIIAFVVLYEFLTDKSIQSAIEVKTRSLRVLLGLTDHLGLQACVPSLALGLSQGMRQRLDADVSEELHQAELIGQLKRSKESPQTRLGVFDRRWRRAERYAPEITKRYGILLRTWEQRLRNELCN